MADVLALDASGRLIVVEIKRDWSDRQTIGQLLEYAARLNGCGVDYLEQVARKFHSNPAYDLYAAFCQEFPDAQVSREAIGRLQRVLVVAPAADENLQAIVKWLGGYGVPIQFVSFSVYGDAAKTPQLLQIEGASASPAEPGQQDAWAGHWIFNTNEAYAPGAYARMFERGVAAIYGYPNGAQNLEGARPGDIVLAYVNQQGLRGIGRVLDGQVTPGTGIFVDADGHQQPEEYHLSIAWEALLSERDAVSAAQAAGLGYKLPVRSVFAKLRQGQLAGVLEKEIRDRANEA